MTISETARAAVVLLDESRHPETLHQPEAIAEAVVCVLALESLEERLKRLAEDQCNIPMSEEQARVWQGDVDALQGRAKTLAESYGVALAFGGDDRGAQLFLQTPKTGRFNGMGGATDGWVL